MFPLCCITGTAEQLWPEPKGAEGRGDRPRQRRQRPRQESHQQRVRRPFCHSLLYFTCLYPHFQRSENYFYRIFIHQNV